MTDTTLTSQRVGELTVVRISGEITSATSSGLQDRLLPLIGQGASLLVDLTAVPYISSAGLRTMLLAHRRAQEVGAAIRLFGLSDEVRFVMSATGFLAFFHIGEDLETELGRARS
ncbi:STAS domain-containing protein [Nonomuraea sp. NBC_00507]|uniref:STAS domain-containing protein n=1 Tax=Nonomuraea sp. NBC_00507 TaxID=2976002 RepID=UPI002E193B27